MTNTDRSEDTSRRSKFEDVAARELGLTEIEVKRGQFSAPCKALVQFRMAGARQTPDVFPLSKLQAVGIVAERNGERIRVVLHGGHVIDGMVVIGGNDGADSEGIGGLWTVVGISEYATDPAALAIQRASLHRTFRKDQLPAGVRVIPEGQYKDAVAAKEKSFSLWSSQRLHKVPNRKLQSCALAALVLSGQRRAAEDASIDVAVLSAPRLLVASDDVKPLQPRFMATDSADADLFLKARDLIDDIAAWCGARGTWDIDGLLKAGFDGAVEKIHPQTDCIHLKGADEEKVFEKPTAKIIELIRVRTGFYVPDLQLVPLVKEGEHVGPETVLFGPMELLPQAARQQLRRMDSAEHELGHPAWLQGIRLMALLSSATKIKGRAHYPIELVVPHEAKQIFVQVAGNGIHGRWDSSIQRISLDRHPSKHLAAAGLGYSFDLYNTSHRSLAMQKIKEFKQRTKAREDGERRAKRAEKCKARSQRQREKVVAPQAESEDTEAAEPPAVEAAVASKEEE